MNYLSHILDCVMLNAHHIKIKIKTCIDSY